MSTAAIEVLRRLSLFRGLSDEVLTAVAERTVFRSLPQGTILFRKGDPCLGLHVVVEGRVQVYRSNRGGREQVLHLQGPEQPLAEVPLLDGGPYPASARALEESRVLFLPLAQFQWLYRHHPKIADKVIQELGRRLRRMVRLVEKISLRDVPARVAMTLLEFAEQAGDLRDGTAFELPRTQEQLASELATTRESVARALGHFRRQGWISTKGATIRILDVARLEEVALSS